MTGLKSDQFTYSKLESILKILLAVVAFLVLLLALFRDFDRDEFEAVHTSWKILNGERIYIDFFQHHHPFYYYLIAPFIHLIGENTSTLLVLRLLSFSMYLGMLWLAFQFSLHFYKNRMVGWVSVLFLSCISMFSQKAIEIRPDVPQVFLALLALYSLFQSKESKKRLPFFLSAISIGLSFLFLQKTIFIIASIGLVQLYWLYLDKHYWTKIVVYWFICGVSIAPYILYLITTSQVEDYVFWNWILNMHFEGGFSAFKAIIDSFYYNHFIWLLFVVGMIKFHKSIPNELIIISITLFGTVFLVQAPYRQYFMPFLPFMSVISASVFLNLVDLKYVKPLIYLIVLVPVIFFTYTGIRYHNFDQLAKIDMVLEHTSPGDYVYDGDARFNLFRNDIDFFWYSTEAGKGGLGTYQKLKPYSYDVLKSIGRYKPKLISDLFIEDVANTFIMDEYIQPKDYPDLYLRRE